MKKIKKKTKAKPMSKGIKELCSQLGWSERKWRAYQKASVRLAELELLEKIKPFADHVGCSDGGFDDYD